MSQQQNLYICIYVPQSLLQKQSAVLKSKIAPLLGNFVLKTGCEGSFISLAF